MVILLDGYADVIKEYTVKIKEYFASKNINIDIQDFKNSACSQFISIYLMSGAKASPDIYSYNLIYDTKNQSFDCIKDYIDPYFFEYKEMIKYFAETAVIASDAILDIYKNDFDVQYKSDSSPVTYADKRSNEIITNALKLKYTDYAILAEETTQTDSQISERMSNPFCFIVDPLDGTKEFVKKNGEFTVNIALAYKNRAISGVIYLPVTRTIYYAARGIGAYKSDFNDIKSGNLFKPQDRIFVSKRTDDLIVMHSKSSFDADTKQIIEENKHRISKLVSRGSAIKMCAIAEGLADVYYRKGYTMEWDTAAGQIIIEEAGGIFRQLDEKFSEMLYNRLDSCNRNGFYVLNNSKNCFK